MIKQAVAWMAGVLSFAAGILFHAKFLDKPELVQNNTIKAKRGGIVETTPPQIEPKETEYKRRKGRHRLFRRQSTQAK